MKVGRVVFGPNDHQSRLPRTPPKGKAVDLTTVSILLRHLEDVLIPLWKDQPVTKELRQQARGLWERVVDLQAALK